MNSQQNHGGNLLAGTKPRTSVYAERIRDVLAKSGHVGRYDPRHVEGYMRLEHSTLDGLSARQFAQEVEMARRCVEEVGVADSQRLAESYGL